MVTVVQHALDPRERLEEWALDRRDRIPLDQSELLPWVLLSVWERHFRQEQHLINDMPCRWAQRQDLQWPSWDLSIGQVVQASQVAALWLDLHQIQT